MWLYDLTSEKIADLIKLFKNKKAQFDQLKKKTKENMWLEDLNELEVQYKKYLKEFNELYV